MGGLYMPKTKRLENVHMRTVVRLGLAMVVALCSAASARGEEQAPYVFERVETAASMSGRTL
jgi:hypothetical protein